MSEGALSPRASGKLIADTSKHVHIDTEEVKACSLRVYKALKNTGFGVASWRQNSLHPKTMDQAAVDWVFLVDSLNFCFWSADPNAKFCVNYGGRTWNGYWSLCAAVNRALEEGVPITDSSFYATIERQDLANIFRSDSEVEIPLLDERVSVLHQVGSVLTKNYGGSFTNCLKQCNGSARELLSLVVREFPPFRDEADYNGCRVSFHKRAQILVADVWGCCEGKGLGEFRDIEEITMFADYRVPQVLVYMGAMKYSQSLLDKLKKDNLLTNGERLEVEIRGCSIWTTELICEEIRRLKAVDKSDVEVNSILIDEFLWDYRRAHAQELESVPYHKVRCIYY